MERIHYWKIRLSTRFGSRDERAAALIEYAFLLGLIALVCILVVTYLGTNLHDNYESVGNRIRDVP